MSFNRWALEKSTFKQTHKKKTYTNNNKNRGEKYNLRVFYYQKVRRKRKLKKKLKKKN